MRDQGAANLDPRIVRLAKTATNIGNAQRVVESMLPDRGLPEATPIAESSVQFVLEPLGVFHWLRTASPAKFRVHLGAPAEGLEGWWRRFLDRPCAEAFRAGHPWLRGRSPADLRWHVPLVLFDDAGPVSKANSTWCRVWYSLLGKGGERESRYLIASGLKDEPGEDKSWATVLASFEQLAAPVAPGTWGGILLFVGADMEYACNVLGLPHYNGTEVCAFCRANSTTRPFNNFHAAAAWRETLVDNDGYRARLREPLHPLVAHPVWSIYTYRLDLLHLLDHHGITSTILGNIFWIHVGGERECNVLPGDTVQERLHF